MRASLRSLLCAAIAVITLTACGQSDAPKTAGAPPDMRRLTEEQYRNTIADVFGTSIKIGGRIDSLVRTNGLLELGARSAAITPSGLEKFDQLARSIADQVVDPAHRDILIGCAPPIADAFDEYCVRQFFTRVGRMLYRRPLTKDELTARINAASLASKNLADFHQGVALSLAAMLVSPNFLFVIDTTEDDPDHAGQLRLDGYAKAARLSYFLWNSTPDDTLLTAAEKGDLATASGRKREIERMIASPRLEGGVRGFFADALALDAFETLEKDSILFPAFNLAVAQDAREQTLRTISAELIAREGDYRDLFTTRRSYMSAALARVYRVYVPKTANWVPYEFAKNDPRVGIQSQISFTALHSHPGRSSPTLRGKALRELLLCQKVPDPPGDVDFTKFNDPKSEIKTAREKLALHTSQAACAGCHKLTDPLGLGLEQFDGAGQHRTTENDVAIDVTGDLDGVKFKDPATLGAAIRANPAVPTCLVSRLYTYAVGRPAATDEQGLIAYLQKRFSDEGYKYPALLRAIASADAFYAVKPREQTPPQTAQESRP